MRYVRAKQKEYFEAQSYRIYVSDAIYHYLHDGNCIGARYADLLNPKPIDNRTGDEIAADVMSRHGLKFGEA